jgi:arsenite methyltransferase
VGAPTERDAESSTVEETMSSPVNTDELTAKVQEMYRQVAEQPDAGFHFELGRPLALRLGYDAEVLDRIPAGAVESFAGVGYFFDLADLGPGETVLDLGSGSGMDAYYAAELVGPTGRVIGVDFTPEQLTKARRLARAAHADRVEFREGRIENPPANDSSIDCVISNGVVNLSPAKADVFAAAARLLRPGGRLAVADIVSEQQLKDSIITNVDLWASCIGGAAQEDGYHAAIEAAGLRVMTVRGNAYEFVSTQARNAGGTYGVKSISVLAVKPTD